MATLNTIPTLPGEVVRALLTVGHTDQWYNRHRGTNYGQASGDLAITDTITISRVWARQTNSPPILQLNSQGGGSLVDWVWGSANAGSDNQVTSADIPSLSAPFGPGHGKRLYLAFGPDDNPTRVELEFTNISTTGDAWCWLILPADAVAAIAAVDVNDTVNLVIADPPPPPIELAAAQVHTPQPQYAAQLSHSAPAPITLDTISRQRGELVRMLITVGHTDQWYNRHRGTDYGQATGDLAITDAITISRVWAQPTASPPILQLNSQGAGSLVDWVWGAANAGADNQVLSSEIAGLSAPFGPGHGVLLYLAFGDGDNPTLVTLDFTNIDTAGDRWTRLVLPTESLAAIGAIDVGALVNLVIAPLAPPSLDYEAAQVHSPRPQYAARFRALSDLAPTATSEHSPQAQYRARLSVVTPPVLLEATQAHSPGPQYAAQLDAGNFRRLPKTVSFTPLGRTGEPINPHSPPEQTLEVQVPSRIGPSEYDLDGEIIDDNRPVWEKRGLSDPVVRDHVQRYAALGEYEYDRVKELDFDEFGPGYFDQTNDTRSERGVRPRFYGMPATHRQERGRELEYVADYAHAPRAQYRASFRAISDLAPSASQTHSPRPQYRAALGVVSGLAYEAEQAHSPQAQHRARLQVVTDVEYNADHAHDPQAQYQADIHVISDLEYEAAQSQETQATYRAFLAVLTAVKHLASHAHDPQAQYAAALQVLAVLGHRATQAHDPQPQYRSRLIVHSDLAYEATTERNPNPQYRATLVSHTEVQFEAEQAHETNPQYAAEMRSLAALDHAARQHYTATPQYRAALAVRTTVQPEADQAYNPQPQYRVQIEVVSDIRPTASYLYAPQATYRAFMRVLSDLEYEARQAHEPNPQYRATLQSLTGLQYAARQAYASTPSYAAQMRILRNISRDTIPPKRGEVVRAVITVGRTDQWYSRRGGDSFGTVEGDIDITDDIRLDRVWSLAGGRRDTDFRLNRSGGGSLAAWVWGAGNVDGNGRITGGEASRATSGFGPGHGKVVCLAFGSPANPTIVVLPFSNFRIATAQTYTLTLTPEQDALLDGLAVGDRVNIVISDPPAETRLFEAEQAHAPNSQYEAALFVRNTRQEFEAEQSHSPRPQYVASLVARTDVQPEAATARDPQPQYAARLQALSDLDYEAEQAHSPQPQYAAELDALSDLDYEASQVHALRPQHVARLLVVTNIPLEAAQAHTPTPQYQARLEVVSDVRYESAYAHDPRPQHRASLQVLSDLEYVADYAHDPQPQYVAQKRVITGIEYESRQAYSPTPQYTAQLRVQKRITLNTITPKPDEVVRALITVGQTDRWYSRRGTDTIGTAEGDLDITNDIRIDRFWSLAGGRRDTDFRINRSGAGSLASWVWGAGNVGGDDRITRGNTAGLTSGFGPGHGKVVCLAFGDPRNPTLVALPFTNFRQATGTAYILNLTAEQDTLLDGLAVGDRINIVISDPPRPVHNFEAAQVHTPQPQYAAQLRVRTPRQEYVAAQAHAPTHRYAAQLVVRTDVEYEAEQVRDPQPQYRSRLIVHSAIGYEARIARDPQPQYAATLIARTDFIHAAAIAHETNPQYVARLQVVSLLAYEAEQDHTPEPQYEARLRVVSDIGYAARTERDPQPQYAADLTVATELRYAASLAYNPQAQYRAFAQVLSGLLHAAAYPHETNPQYEARLTVSTAIRPTATQAQVPNHQYEARLRVTTAINFEAEQAHSPQAQYAAEARLRRTHQPAAAYAYELRAHYAAELTIIRAVEPPVIPILPPKVIQYSARPIRYNPQPQMPMEQNPLVPDPLARRSAFAASVLPGDPPDVLAVVPPVDPASEDMSLQHRVDAHLDDVEFPRYVVTLHGVEGAVALRENVRLRLIDCGPVTILSAEGGNEVYYENGPALLILDATDTAITVVNTEKFTLLKSTDCTVQVGNCPLVDRLNGTLMQGTIVGSAVGQSEIVGGVVTLDTSSVVSLTARDKSAITLIRAMLGTVALHDSDLKGDTSTITTLTATNASLMLADMGAGDTWTLVGSNLVLNRTRSGVRIAALDLTTSAFSGAGVRLGALTGDQETVTLDGGTIEGVLESAGTVTLNGVTVQSALIHDNSILNGVSIAGSAVVDGGRHAWTQVAVAGITSFRDAVIQQNDCRFQGDWSLDNGTIYLDHGSEYAAGLTAIELIGRNRLEKLEVAGAASWATTGEAYIALTDVESAGGLRLSGFQEVGGEQCTSPGGATVEDADIIRLSGHSGAVTVARARHATIANAQVVTLRDVGQASVVSCGTVIGTDVKQLIAASCGNITNSNGQVYARDCGAVVVSQCMTHVSNCASVSGSGLIISDDTESAGANTAIVLDRRELTIRADDIVLEGAVDVNGSHLRHNGTNVGDDHVHGGVRSGGSTTSGPL